MAELRIDPFVSTEPEVELDSETSRILEERLATADQGQLVPRGRSTEAHQPVAFKLLYHKDALTDLEEF